MINGSIVNLISPTCSDGSLDYETLEALVDWHIENSSAALLIGSSIGQSGEFNIDERSELLKRAIWQSDGRIPIIADLGTAKVEQVFELARAADEFGASAVLLTLPTTMGLSQDDLLQHIGAVAKLAKLPLILRDDFTHPNLLSPAALATFAQVNGVVGFVNDAVNSTTEAHTQELPKDFALYAGHDANACELILGGYKGGISIVANIAPTQVQNMFTAAQAGERSSAEALNALLQPLSQALLKDPNSIPVMWALVEMGCIPEGEQPPTLAQPSDYANLRRALRAAQISI